MSVIIIIPHVFQDGVGEIGSGVQLNENFNVVKTALESQGDDIETLLAAIPNLKFAVGQANANWAGGLSSPTITHGLGRTPIFAAASALETGGNIYAGILNLGVKVLNGTQVQFGWSAAPGITIPDGGVTPFRWIAVG